MRPLPRWVVQPASTWTREHLGPPLGRTLDFCRQPPAGLLPGPVPGSRSTAALPVVLVLVLGEPSAEAVTGAIDRLVTAVSAGCGSRPVVVLDTAQLHQVRRAGMVAEYLMPRRVLTTRFPGLRYDAYLAAQLTILTRDYATGHLLTLTADAVPEPQELSRLLHPAPAGLARRLARLATTRAETFLDRSASSG